MSNKKTACIATSGRFGLKIYESSITDEEHKLRTVG